MWNEIKVWSPVAGGIAIAVLVNPPIRLFNSNPWADGRLSCSCERCQQATINDQIVVPEKVGYNGERHQAVVTTGTQVACLEYYTSD
jgi:hypothetical protein